MQLKTILDQIIAGQKLDLHSGVSFVEKVASADFLNMQMAALLGLLRGSILSPEFLVGVRSAALAHAVPLKLDCDTCIDVCGTGGDQKDTFNISTSTALVLAACGYQVVKHGNYSVSSRCGSSNVLEALGYQFPQTAEAAQKEFARHGITFLHAPFFHPIFKNVAPVRKELGVRTIFNLLGPLVNPARPKFQLIGVSDFSLQRFLNSVLEQTEVHYSLVHSLDGYDEISLTDRFKIFSVHGQELVDPRELGLAKLEPKAIQGGQDSQENAEIIKTIMSGAGTEAQVAAVCSNVAAALRLFDPKLSWCDGVLQAKEAIHSGATLILLKKLLA